MSAECQTCHARHRIEYLSLTETQFIELQKAWSKIDYC